MREPCRSCERKHLDFGGCRCQAFQLTGDARNADPVCIKSPQHHLIDITTAEVPYRYRVFEAHADAST